MFNSNDRDKFGRFDDNSEIIPLYNETKERFRSTLRKYHHYSKR